MNIKDIMLISPEEVKAQSDINYNVDDTMIGASIRVSQNVYLRDVIGTELLEKIQQLIANAIEDNGDMKIDDEGAIAYKTLLDDYITPVLTYKVASEICARISKRIRNAGVVSNSDTNMNAASLQDIVYMKDTYDTYYNDALNRMVEFICKNEEAYPESNFVCGCGKSPKYARTGLWLG